MRGGVAPHSTRWLRPDFHLVGNLVLLKMSRATVSASRDRAGKHGLIRPEFVESMKPRFVDALPEGPEWIYELKFDGYRAQILKHGSGVRLLSRNNKSLAA